METTAVPLPEYLQILIGVFALVSPPVIVPMFLGIVSGRSVQEKKTVAHVGAIGFFVATTIFVFAGEGLLSLFGIEISAFQVAGGFLLLLIALDMMNSSAGDDNASGKKGGSLVALGIVPLTVPILAGPGVLSAVVLFSSEFGGLRHNLLMVLVMAAVSAGILITLRIAVASDRFFTPNVTLVFNKVMGLMIAAIAFEFILDGIATHFPLLATTP